MQLSFTCMHAHHDCVRVLYTTHERHTLLSVLKSPLSPWMAYSLPPGCGPRGAACVRPGNNGTVKNRMLFLLNASLLNLRRQLTCNAWHTSQKIHQTRRHTSAHLRVRHLLDLAQKRSKFQTHFFIFDTKEIIGLFIRDVRLTLFLQLSPSSIFISTIDRILL